MECELKPITMIRVIKATFTTNLIAAALVVLAYILYGLWSKLPIDLIFLGTGPDKLGRGSSAQIPAWVLVALVELGIMIILVIGKARMWDMKGHRKFCGIVGLVGLYMVVLSLLWRDSIVAPRFDHILACYVWGSHFTYALIGPNDN